MSDNPFEPPAADVGVRGEHFRRPLRVALLALLVAGIVLAFGVRAVVYGTLAQAAVAVFLCAFVSFVPAGLWLGRPWAPPVGVLFGLIAAALAFGALIVEGAGQANGTFVFRLLAGTAALGVAALLPALRRHPFFAVTVVRERT